MKSQVLLFDLGGVLLDWVGPEQLLLLLDGRFTLPEICDMWPDSPSLRRFETGEITGEKFSSEFVAEWKIKLDPESFLREFSSWTRLAYPGALTLLKALRGSMILACLTNSNASYWSRIRDDLGFGENLDHCYASHELGMLKPDREIFEYVLEDLNCEPDQVTFFDDTRKNVVAAREVGMHAYEVQGLAELQNAIRNIRAVNAP